MYIFINKISQPLKDVIMNEKSIQRPELSKKQIKRCHKIIDELVALYAKTDPKYGEKSQENKQEYAYQALNKVGELAGILTEWAENQLFGIYARVAESKDGWIDQKTCDQHTNETMWYDPELPEDIFEGETKLICERLAIGSILHNTFSRYGRMGWRLSLEHSLYALNEGQVEWLMTPVNIRKQGDAFDLQELRWIVVKHLYKLIGQGVKKMAAEAYLADVCNVKVDAIQKWEKEAVKERDKERNLLEAIKLGSLYIHGMTQGPESYDKEDLFQGAIYWNQNADDVHLKNLSFGIITVIKIDEEFPLETMADRLSAAGLRAKGTK